MIDQTKYNEINNWANTTEKVDALIDYLFDIRKFDPEKSIEIANEVIALSDSLDYPIGKGRAINHKGFCLALMAEYHEALLHFDESLVIAKRIGSKGLEARIYKNYGNVYRDLGRLSESFSYYENAIFIYEKLGREKDLGTILLQISNLHLDLYEFDNALEYAMRCVPIFAASDDVELIGEVHFTLGNIYFKQDVYEKAKIEFQHVMDLSPEHSIGYMMAEIGLGKVAFKTKDLLIAKEYLRNGLAQADELNHIEGLITAHYYLGRLLMGEDHLLNAKKHFEIAFNLAQEHSRRHDVMSIHGMMSQLFEKLGDVNEAYFHLKAFEKLKETIFQQNTINKLRHLQSKQELEMATKEKEVAEKTAKLKQQFIANMSHEIRTPMNAIVGMTRLLSEREPRDDQKRYLNAISQSADNLLIIINDILDFSKIEAGKVRIEKINFSLKDCLKNVVNILRIKAEEKGLKLWFNMEENVPQTVTGDPTRLTQVLINLVGNAVKFTEHGKVDIVVFLEKVEEDVYYVRFQVIDTGIGISEEYVSRIFESFTQAGTDMARKFGGTGLGLTISKELVLLMKGELGVKSQLGEGTTFEFSLPFKVPAEDIVVKDKKEFSLTDRENKVLNNMHILLAEDNQFNRILAEDVLKDVAPFIQITNAENGVDVLELLEENSFDLILMDIQMPVMTGLDATKVIRKGNKTIPILAMTANVMQDDIASYLAEGMNDHVPKPFGKEDLIAKMLKHVNQDAVLAHAQNEVPVESKVEETATVSSNVYTARYVDDTFLTSFTGGKPDKMRKYLQLFLDNAPQMELKLEKGIAEQSHAEVKIAAHSLKSQLRYLGVKEEASGVYALEKMGAEQVTFDTIKAQFTQLKRVLKSTYAEAQELIDAL